MTLNILHFCILILAATYLEAVAANEVGCSEDFCTTYRQQHECNSLGSACNVQNSTYNGERYPAGVPCGCCEVCLENLNEGDFCSVGSPDVTAPLLVCGPGLYCSPTEKGDFTCQKMTHTQCFKDQLDFDERQRMGKTGMYEQRPSCDGDGNYQRIRCNLNQTCFCVNKEGQRIFGEEPYSRLTELQMSCECSRFHDDLNELMMTNFKYPAMGARCSPDGSFDQMQCMGDMCTCVEASSGFPGPDTYNMTNLEYDLLECFDPHFHLTFKYLHGCEERLSTLLHDIKSSEMDGFSLLDWNAPNCNPDGWFHPLQENQTHFFCVDKYGIRLGNYEAERESEEGANMNCKCASTRSLLQKRGEEVLPTCDKNGNFEQVQCKFGNCFCVDKDGLQIGKEVKEKLKTQLECSNP